jgi:acetyltransferase-like isoleucine patch superfamily enzyme
MISSKISQTFLKKLKYRLKLYILRIAKHIIFSNTLRMFFYKKIIGIPIGKKSIIWAGNKINEASNLKIGNNVIIGPANVFLIRGGLVIGNNVNLSGFSFFISQEHDVNDPYSHTKLSPIVIKDNAWIATNSTILPGVTIGEGSVVAAGSVVTKNVPPYSVVAGNPAKEIKKRNKTIKYVLSDIHGIKWI